MFLFIHFFRFTEEIVDIFVVNFKEGSFHFICPAFFFEGFGDGVDLMDRSWDHSVVGGGHCIGFSRTGLAVGKDTNVVSV